MKLINWICVYLAAAAIWLGVYVMIVHVDVGAIRDFTANERLLSYGLFILAPLLTFLPIARALRIPLYDLEAVAAWSTLLFVITFIDPGTNPSFPILLFLLLSLVMSLATIFTLLSYAFGYRLLTRRSQKYDFLRARREGYLISMFLVGLLLLHVLEVLTVANGALLALIVTLLEIFLLSRGQPANPGRDVEVYDERAKA